jgi:hypothetical protein
MHIQKTEAPDYWALSPYYEGVPIQKKQKETEPEGCACSTSISSIVNGARIRKSLTANDRMADSVTIRYQVKVTGLDLNERIKTHRGIDLHEMKAVLEATLKYYNVNHFKIEVVPTNDLSEATKNQLHRDLIENEKTDRNFIMANFVQGVFTNDYFGGHWAPIGAYDEERKQVLVLDPDRAYYEPYWVSESVFLEGMTGADEKGEKGRGYVKIEILD